MERTRESKERRVKGPAKRPAGRQGSRVKFSTSSNNILRASDRRERVEKPVSGGGVVVAVNISEEKGTRKKNIGRCKVLREHGLKGDAHAGKWHRQVSLLAQESIDKMQAHLPDFQLKPGDFAENITTKGVELRSLPIGTKLTIGGNVLLEVTQIGKECHLACEIRKIVGDCIMPREGIFAKVLKEGEIKVGDEIRIQSNEKRKNAKPQIKT